MSPVPLRPVGSFERGQAEPGRAARRRRAPKTGEPGTAGSPVRAMSGEAGGSELPEAGVCLPELLTRTKTAEGGISPITKWPGLKALRI